MDLTTFTSSELMERAEGKEMGIEALPDDMLHLIVSKLASSSCVDFCNARQSCKSFKFDLSDNVIGACLKLDPLVTNPKKATNYMSMIDSCLKVGNFDAHFIKGVIEFFDRNNIYLGLHHLQVATKGGHLEGSYLFGVLLMCLGMIDEGKKVINHLADTQGVISVERCWATIHDALREFSLSMKDVYVTSYTSMKPDLHCHPQKFNTVCSKCFHFFLISEFFEMVMSLGKVIDP